jgi:hypothetical protein
MKTLPGVLFSDKKSFLSKVKKKSNFYIKKNYFFLKLTHKPLQGVLFLKKITFFT